MHDDWSFSTPLRALSACITAVKWAPATKDLQGKRVVVVVVAGGGGVGEFAEHQSTSTVV